MRSEDKAIIILIKSVASALLSQLVFDYRIHYAIFALRFLIYRYNIYHDFWLNFWRQCVVKKYSGSPVGAVTKALA